MKYHEGDLVGPYNHYLIETWVHVTSKGNRRTMGLFECSLCGAWFKNQVKHISSGHNKSCGCLTRTHNLTGSKYHKAWVNMKRRCLDPEHSHYHRYGGRGIKICERWLNTTGLLRYREDIDKQLEKQGLTLEDWGMGTKRFTVDRIDNDGDYEPSNIRFATPKEQGGNK